MNFIKTVIFLALIVPAQCAWGDSLFPLTPEKLKNISSVEFIELLPGAVRKSYEENLKSKDYVVPDFESIVVGEHYFFPFQLVVAGQPDVSFEFVLDKIIEAEKTGALVWVEKYGKFELQSNKGKSLFGEESCGTGITIGEKVYLNDGNTKSLASILMGATQYCVKIVEKYPEGALQNPEMRQDMIEKGYIFPWDENGNEIENLPEWTEVADHPGRTFLVSRRAKVKAIFHSKNEVYPGKLEIEFKPGKMHVSKVAFIKVNNDIPFLELKLWIAAIQVMSPNEILSLGTENEDIDRLIKAIREGAKSDHPALKGLEKAFLLNAPGQFQQEEHVIKAIRHRSLLRCDALLRAN